MALHFANVCCAEFHAMFNNKSRIQAVKTSHPHVHIYSILFLFSDICLECFWSGPVECFRSVIPLISCHSVNINPFSDLAPLSIWNFWKGAPRKSWKIYIYMYLMEKPRCHLLKFVAGVGCRDLPVPFHPPLNCIFFAIGPNRPSPSSYCNVYNVQVGVQLFHVYVWGMLLRIKTVYSVFC